MRASPPRRASPTWLRNRLGHVRNTTAAFSAIALSAFVLTGCAAVPEPGPIGCERANSEALAMSVTASGDIGKAKVELTTPIPTSKVIYSDLIVGSGLAVRESDQNVVGTITLINGATGQVIDSGAGVWSPKSLSDQFGGAGAVLECATEGSRVAFAVPSVKLPEAMASQIGLGPKDSLAGTIDIQEVLRPRAQGSDVFNDARGLPTVVRAPDGRPGIIIPDGAAPKKLVTQTLIAGDGPKVDAGLALFQYTAVSWDRREVTRSSWDSGVVFDSTTLPEDVMKQVSKAKVGSQLLAVVPGNTETTVYVVDVLGIVPPELVNG